LVVGRANEGFDDKNVDICINLDFSQNKNMLLTLQRCGRTQRISINKNCGYYICPLLANNEEEYRQDIANYCFNYIQSITLNPTRKYIKGDKKDSIVKDIIERFEIEGNKEYTHDDILKRMLQIKKENSLTSDQFVKILLEWDIKTHNEFITEYNKNESKFKEIGISKLYEEKIKDFSWDLIQVDDYYDKTIIIDKIKYIYKNNKNKFKNKSGKKINKLLNKIDPKIPDQYPWKYYKLNRTNFNFIYG